jgi:hypothetical protein
MGAKQRAAMRSRWTPSGLVLRQWVHSVLASRLAFADP